MPVSGVPMPALNMPAWKARLLRVIDVVTRLLQRYPRLLALFGFCSGLASFFLVDRQASLAKLIAAVTLLSWVWLTLENLVRRWVATRLRFELPVPLLRYATQMVHQESLFFVLPFFAVTTTWNSGQLLFTGLLGLAALISIIDPLYYHQLVRRQLLFMSFHSLTLFAVLLTALPIIAHLNTARSYQWALGISVLLSFPSLTRTVGGLHGWRRWAATLGLLAALGGIGWQARLWVPPATLWMTQMAVSDRLTGRDPGERLETIDVAQLRRNGLYAYTAISAPGGLQERIYHVWLHDGREVDRIALDISGGRKAGYRAWSHKRHFPEQPLGHWQVRVVTEAGQMIGTLRFRVVR